MTDPYTEAAKAITEHESFPYLDDDHIAAIIREKCEPKPITGDPAEAVVKRLRDAATAYPEDIFQPLTAEDREQHGVLISRASAAMGRHFSRLFTEAADEIEQLRAEVERLTRLIDESQAKGENNLAIKDQQIAATEGGE